jgi:hypothetical protein
MELTIPGLVGILNLILIIIVGGFNFFSHNKIVYNDLKHLNDDVKTLIARQEGISEKVNVLSIDLAYVKGKCTLHTSKTKTFKKSKKILNKV